MCTYLASGLVVVFFLGAWALVKNTLVLGLGIGINKLTFTFQLGCPNSISAIYIMYFHFVFIGMPLCGGISW